MNLSKSEDYFYSVKLSERNLETLEKLKLPSLRRIDFPIPPHLRFQMDCRRFWEPIGYAARRFWFHPWLRSPYESVADVVRGKLAATHIQLIDYSVNCQTSIFFGLKPDPSKGSYFQGRIDAFCEILKHLENR